MKKLLFVLSIAAFGLMSFDSNMNQKTSVESPKQSSWNFIGEQDGVKFYWKITSATEGKLKAENTTGNELYVEFDYKLLDANGNVVKKGYGGFGNVSAHSESTHPITDWGNKGLKEAIRIEIDDIKVKIPY